MAGGDVYVVDAVDFVVLGLALAVLFMILKKCCARPLDRPTTAADKTE